MMGTQACGHDRGALACVERLEKAVQAAYCMGWNDMALQEPGFQDEPPVLLPEVQRKLAALAGETEPAHDPLTCPCCRAAAATLDPESFERFEARRDRAEALLKEP